MAVEILQCIDSLNPSKLNAKKDVNKRFGCSLRGCKVSY